MNAHHLTVYLARKIEDRPALRGVSRPVLDAVALETVRYLLDHIAALDGDELRPCEGCERLYLEADLKELWDERLPFCRQCATEEEAAARRAP